MTIHHLASPAHDIDHLDSIYRSVEALIESIDERDSDLAVALQHEDECSHCFRHALLHVVELLPHCATTAVAVDMAQQNHMTYLEEGMVPATAMRNLTGL
jgi:hypothetical protein